MVGTQRKGVASLPECESSGKDFRNLDKMLNQKSSSKIVFTVLSQLSKEKMDRKKIKIKRPICQTMPLCTGMMGDSFLFILSHIVREACNTCMLTGKCQNTNKMCGT